MWHDMQEIFAALFILENLLFFSLGVSFVIRRFMAARQRHEEEFGDRQTVAEGESKRELEDMRNELGDLREMMADMLIEMNRDRETLAVGRESTKE